MLEKDVLTFVIQLLWQPGKLITFCLKWTWKLGVRNTRRVLQTYFKTTPNIKLKGWRNRGEIFEYKRLDSGHALRVSDDTDGVAFRIDRSIGTC